MATSFPGSIDVLTNPTATDALNSVTVPHATQHTNANDAIEAIETALGANLGNVVASANGSVTGPLEKWNVSATASTGTINIDVKTAGVWYYTTDATANFTLNFRGNSSTTLASMLAVGQAITVLFLCGNGATPYYGSAYQIDGSSVTPKWQNGFAPTAGNASSVDIYTVTIVKTAATPTYTAFASMVKYA